jgi:hypothetical protein
VAAGHAWASPGISQKQQQRQQRRARGSIDAAACQRLRGNIVDGADRTLTANKTSEVEFFEDAVGDVADDEHDGLPLEWDVEVVLFCGDGFDDGLRDFVDVGEFFAALHACGHGGFGGAGLDGDDGDAFAVDTVAEAAEEG